MGGCEGCAGYSSVCALSAWVSKYGFEHCDGFVEAVWSRHSWRSCLGGVESWDGALRDGGYDASVTSARKLHVGRDS